MKKYRQPLGRSRSLQRREAEAWREEEIWRQRQADRQRKPNRHTGLLIGLSVFFAVGILACGALLLVMAGGENGSFTVVEGGLVLRSGDRERRFASLQAEEKTLREKQQLRTAEGDPGDGDRWPLVKQYQGRFTPGIIIDGLDVAGLTREEARAELQRLPAGEGGTYALTVEAGTRFTVSSEIAPMIRDIDDQLDSAWEYAWEGMPCTDLRGPLSAGAVTPADGETPFEARVRSLRAAEAAREAALDETERMLEARARQPMHFSTDYTFDRDAIRVITDSIAKTCTREPVNAVIEGFDPGSRTFSVTAEINGADLDADLLFDQVMASLERGETYSTLYITPEIVPAAVTRSALQSRLGMISTFTTATTGNANRNTNIRLSAEAINGYRVNPGDSFSFNNATGQRTERKGYKPAAAISGGQTKDEIGGGVCQTSSTLFNAVARGNFEVVSRSPHAWPSSYVEKGMDATVDTPSPDFIWRNNSEYPVFIWAHYENQQITVSLYGMKLEDGVSYDLESVVVQTYPKPEGTREVRNENLPAGTRKKTVTARKGYEVETYKLKKIDGEVQERTLFFTSTYKAYQETWEYN